jgi:endoglucanase
MKTVILIFSLSVLMFMAKAQPVKEHGQLKVKGTQLVDQSGKPVMLAGVSYGWHNWWPRFSGID